MSGLGLLSLAIRDGIGTLDPPHPPNPNPPPEVFCFAQSPTSFVGRWRVNDVVLATAPVDYVNFWNFDNVDATTIFDETGNDNITITGTAQYTAGIESNGVTKTTNTVNYSGNHAVPTAANQPFSISLWIRATGIIGANAGASNLGTVFAFGSDFLNTGILVQVNDTTGDLLVSIGDGVSFDTNAYIGKFNTDISMDDRVWHNLVITCFWDGATFDTIVYLDGFRAPISRSKNIVLFDDTFHLLNMASTNNELLRVVLDNVKIYDRVLTAEEVTLLNNDFQPVYDATLSANNGNSTKNLKIAASGFNGGYSMIFDGVEDRVHIPNHGTLSPAVLSVTAWINKGPSATGGILCNTGNKIGDNVVGFKFFAQGNLQVEIADGTGTTFSSVTTLKAISGSGLWVHVGFTFDGTTIKLYIDGILEGSGVSATPLSYGVDAKVTLGAIFKNGVYTDFLEGSLDDIRIYDTVLTAAQMFDISTDTSEVGANDFISFLIVDDIDGVGEFNIGLWRMDEAASPAIDNSGGGHNMTITNGIFQQPSFLGDGIEFNGVDAVGDFTSSTFLELAEFTIGMWINVDDISVTGNIINYSGGGALDGWEIKVTPELLFYRTFDAGAGPNIRINRPTGINDGYIHHVIFTLKTLPVGSRLRIYVDGELSEEIYSLDQVSYNAAGLATGVGALRRVDAPPTTHFMKGTLSELRIFSSEFNLLQARDLYGLSNTTIRDLALPIPMTAFNFPVKVLGPNGTVGVNEALQFNGVDQYGEFPASVTDFATPNFSVGIWVKYSNVGNNILTLYSFADGSGFEHSGWLLRKGLNDSADLVVASNTGQTVNVDFKVLEGTIPIDDNEWHYVAGTYDGTDMKLYIDGILDVEVEFLNGVGYKGFEKAAIAKGQAAFSSYLTGTLSEPVFYDYAVEGSTISALASSGPCTIQPSSWRTDYLHRWTGDNANIGLVFDGVGASNLTRNAAVTIQRGQVGNAIGASSFASNLLKGSAEAAVPTEFTLMFWMKRDGADWVISSGAVCIPFAFRSDWSNEGMFIQALDDQMSLIVGDGVSFEGFSGTGNVVGDNEWVFYTWTLDSGGNTQSYVNGLPVSGGAGATWVNGTNDEIFVMGRNRLTEAVTNMQLDEIRWWDLVIEDSEILRIYQDEAGIT